MIDRQRISRRTVLTVTAMTGTTALAGCADDGDPEDDPADEPEEDPEAVDVEEWADIEEFYFDGQVSHWGGIEPDIIENEENPTLTLIEGQEYDFRWINVDGQLHNLEIRDGDDQVIDDYQSEDVEEEGEETTLEGVVASEDMTTYICQYHEATQVGDITVETE